MDVREEIEKRIEKKAQEIREYELKIAEANSYVQALSDTLRLLPKNPATPPNPDMALRPGTVMAKTREAIKRAGKPLHIAEILEALGRPVNRENRGSIGGSLSAYVRKGEVFTKIAPNTFGLVELGHKTQWSTAILDDSPTDEPPESFGGDSETAGTSANGKVDDDEMPF